MTGVDGRPARHPGQRALRFVLLIGVVSLFADLTYEGSRSIVGPYLGLLGASAGAVAVVAGAGEFLGYALRLVSGRAADASGRYWPITILGYVVQMASVPALAVAGSWQGASALVVLERVGKALRNPPRDAMLAEATTEIGRGWGFGVHEVLDQLGAMIGPLVVAVVVAASGEYRLAFAILLVPAVLALASLLVARLTNPNPRHLSGPVVTADGDGLSGRFWTYLAASALVAAGTTDFPLIAFHLERGGDVPAALIPVAYAAAMGAGGLGSLLLGRPFDRHGVVILIPLTLATLLAAPLAFLGAPAIAFAGIVLWGLGTGVHGSIAAAAVASMVPRNRIATAYGLFDLGYGAAWFVGSAAMGLLYGASLAALAGLSVALQLVSIPLLWRLARGRRRPSAA